MRQSIKKFFKTDDGAVTVDWVVLTAAVVAMAGAVFLSIQNGTDDVGDGVGNYLTNSDAGNF